MSVYVDRIFSLQSRDPQAFRVGQRTGHKWCHMWADTAAELHAMADLIGMKRAWFQDKASLPHYDLVPSRRRLALLHGAVEATVAGWISTRRAAGGTVLCYRCAARPQRGGPGAGAFLCEICGTSS